MIVIFCELDAFTIFKCHNHNVMQIGQINLN